MLSFIIITTGTLAYKANDETETERFRKLIQWNTVDEDKIHTQGLRIEPLS